MKLKTGDQLQWNPRKYRIQPLLDTGEKTDGNSRAPPDTTSSLTVSVETHLYPSSSGEGCVLHHQQSHQTYGRNLQQMCWPRFPFHSFVACGRVRVPHNFVNGVSTPVQAAEVGDRKELNSTPLDGWYPLKCQDLNL